jgi:hypothetical protein
MDDLDLANHARLLWPRLPVLLASGFPGVRGGDQRTEGSPFPLLNKPYSRDELARTVCEALNRNDDRAVDAGRGQPGEPEHVKTAIGP